MLDQLCPWKMAKAGLVGSNTQQRQGRERRAKISRAGAVDSVYFVSFGKERSGVGMG
jgi:hypothetical protein